MSCEQLFKNIHIFPVLCMYISEMIYHIKIYIEKLVYKSAINNHNTHLKLNLHVQFCRMNAFKKSVMGMGIQLYNNYQKIGEENKMRQFKSSSDPIYYNIHFTL
jgi:hypothetical protein